MEKYQAAVFLASENAISHLVHGHPEEEVVIPLSGGLELFKQNDDLKHGRNFGAFWSALDQPILRISFPKSTFSVMF